MKRKKIINLILLIIICITLTGCLESNSEKNLITKNAINYLKEKYDIKRFQYRITNNSFYGDSHKCFITCEDNRMRIKYKKNIYEVYYDKEKKEFSDNLQYEKIKNDLIDSFSKKYYKPKDIEIKFDEYNSAFYNETNLDNMIRNLSLTAYYNSKKEYNEENAKNILTTFYNTYGSEITLIYFEDNNDYKNYMKYRDKDIILTTSQYGTTEKYIDFFITIKNGNIEKNISSKINLGNGFIGASWNLKDGIKLEETQPFDLNKIENYNQSKYYINSKFYKIKSNQNDFHLTAVNIMSESDEEIDDVMIAAKLISNNGEVKYELKKGIDKNKLYITKYFNYKEMDFVLLKEY